jgi:hypothetical protein
MGFHAHLLEPRRRASDLYPLHFIHRQPRPIRIPLEPIPLDPAIPNLPLRLLDMGHGELAKEYVQSTRKRCRAEQKDFSSIALEKC